MQSGGCRWPGLLRTNVYSDFHPSGVGKWVPAAAGKAKASMAHCACGWYAGCAGKTVIPLDNACNTWAPQRHFVWRRYTNRLLYLYISFKRMLVHLLQIHNLAGLIDRPFTKNYRLIIKPHRKLKAKNNLNFASADCEAPRSRLFRLCLNSALGISLISGGKPKRRSSRVHVGFLGRGRNPIATRKGVWEVLWWQKVFHYFQHSGWPLLTL